MATRSYYGDILVRKKGKRKHFLESVVEILWILTKEPLNSSDLFKKRPVTRSDRFYSYLRLLQKHGLVEKDEGVYRITEAGRNFLQIFSD